MKTIFLFLALLGFFTMNNPVGGIHDFTLDDIDGKPAALAQYDGKVVLIVNVASKCGFTKQYEGLQELYDAYGDEGLVILGFPANDFRGQEPGSNEEIKLFCSETYGVSFPMFSKISVIGDEMHPLFAHLTQADNPDFTGDIKWNFEKFLIGKDGQLLRRYRSQTTPDAPELVDAIKEALTK